MPEAKSADIFKKFRFFFKKITIIACSHKIIFPVRIPPKTHYF